MPHILPVLKTKQTTSATQTHLVAIHPKGFGNSINEPLYFHLANSKLKLAVVHTLGDIVHVFTFISLHATKFCLKKTIKFLLDSSCLLASPYRGTHSFPQLAPVFDRFS